MDIQVRCQQSVEEREAIVDDEQRQDECQQHGEECVAEQLDADILQATAHQLLYVYHLELLQYAAQAHIGVVAAGDDEHQQSSCEADVK